MVLMMAMSTTPDITAHGGGYNGCTGTSCTGCWGSTSTGCWGSSSCHGNSCHGSSCQGGFLGKSKGGFLGGGGFMGKHKSNGCCGGSSCHGCSGSSCHGCNGGVIVIQPEPVVVHPVAGPCDTMPLAPIHGQPIITTTPVVPEMKKE